MRGIQIKNGLVVNIAIFVEIPNGWTEAPEGVGINWTDNGDGTFSAPVTPPLTSEELSANERIWRDSELRRADIEVFKAEDLAGAFDAEGWRIYRKDLRVWPDSVDFPDSTKRPVAPDNV